MLIICTIALRMKATNFVWHAIIKKGLVYWEKGGVQQAAMELWLHVRRC